MSTRIKRDDFLENRNLSNIKVNNDEDKAAFIVNEAILDKNNYEDSLWMIYLNNNNVKKLHTEGSIKGFEWRDNYIIYCIIKGNSSIFYKYDVNIDSSEKMLSIPMIIGEFMFINNKLFFSSKNSIIERTKNVEEGTELPFYSEGVGLTSNYRKYLYSYNICNDKIMKITKEDIDIINFSRNKSGDKIVFVSSVNDTYIRNETNLYILDTGSEKFEIVSRQNPLRISSISFIDNETLIFAGLDLQAYGRHGCSDFYTLDVNTRKESKITENFNKSFQINGITTESRFGQSNSFYVYENQVYFLTIENSNGYINKINKTGEYKRIYGGNGTVDSFAVLGKGIIFIGLRGQACHEVYLLNEEREHRLTSFNHWFTENRIITKPDSLNYINSDGIEIEGWVISPAEFDKNKIYPGILFIHGGPDLTYSSVYHHTMHLLAAKDYYVFFCNPRGGSGRGYDFSDIRGNFASYAFSDIMGFIEEVLNNYKNIDKNRIGVMGGSYGGYMTNYIIAHTNRFSAAVAERSISNAISMFNTSDVGYAYMSYYMGEFDLWSNPEAYINASPIIFANKIKTPTLFIHGKKDRRCHYSESLQMFSALKYFGIDSKLCLFEEESHSLEVRGKPLNKIKRYNEIINWFNKYLKII